MQKSKKDIACKKGNIWNPAASSCENCKCLANTTDDSVIMCDKTIYAAESISANVLADISSTVSINGL